VAGDVAGGLSAEAHGLRLALLIVTPISLLLAAAGLFGAARHVERDHEAVLARTT
jgi:hypothetical protein